MSRGLSTIFSNNRTSLVTIVIPAMNESDNVLTLVERVHAAVKDARVEVFYIDDSRDTKTVEKVAEAQEIYGSQKFIVRIFHRTGADRWGGLSGAVTNGMKRANGDSIIVMDGDLQHPPELITEMLEEAEHHDLVVASRYCEGGSAGGLDGGIRHFVSRGSTLLAKLFFPSRLRAITDPMTGFFMVDRKQLNFSLLRPKGFKILLEILATHPGLTRVEVPLEFGERFAGESKTSFKQGREFVTQLLMLKAHELVRAVIAMPKFLQFALIGGGSFLVGMALLFIQVEVFGISPLVANAVQLAVTFALNYWLNSTLTWGERDLKSDAVYKFVFSRGVTSVLNYYLFVLLFGRTLSVGLFGQSLSLSIGYLVANVMTLIAITVLNFLVSDLWAFAEKSEQPTLSQISKLNVVEPGTGEGHYKLDLTAAVQPVPDYVEAFYTAKEHKAFVPAPTILSRFTKYSKKINTYSVGLAVILLCSIAFAVAPGMTVAVLLAIAGVLLFVQSSIEVWRILYAYRNPTAVEKLKFPILDTANEKFCLIVPARHESEVLATTLEQLAKQTHPDTHIITVMCDDDHETLKVAYETAIRHANITVMQYPLQTGEKPNKPKQLNYVYGHIQNQDYTVVGIFDAEDTVHPGLLERVDAAFADAEVGIVQGGVQLMNHDSTWYSLHNVLEYYRWFNSAMSFQAAYKFMPLGGNTIFIKNELLQLSGGWPETLTEDCSLGVLLSTRHSAKTAVYYEAEYATREETPDSLSGLFKQRVRWNQGFFQEWLKGVWRELPTFRQKLLANYVLMGPIILGGISVLMIASILAAFFLNAPVRLVMLMYLSLIPGLLLVILNVVFLHDFGKAYDRRVSMKHYAVLLSTSIFYQIVLNAAAFWAMVRHFRGEQSWHKTSHSGLHRASAQATTSSAIEGSSE